MNASLWYEWAVYPRVCGGTAVLLYLRPYRIGLSPRVRGNLGLIANRSIYDRSIPACAGEPYNRVIRLIGGEVYPRVCGGTAQGALI